MTQTSWLKKIWNGRSKGVSTVIGTVFLMLIIFMVSTNVLLWTFSQNTQYNEAVMERNQEEADRLNENVIASEGNYTVLPGCKVKVEAKLTNAGSVAVQIINLWVFDNTIQEYNYTSLNLNLNPGNVTDLTGSNAISVTIDGADSAHDFISWFVTARGNTIPLEKEQEQSEEQSVIMAQTSQGIGSMALNFSTFRYYTYDGDKLANYPSGIYSFTIPYKGEIAFGVNLTNLDPSNQSITLDMHSQLWLYFPGSPGQAQGPVWYIVNVDSDGTIINKDGTTYSPITLEWGDSMRLVFASAEPSEFTKVLSSDTRWKEQQKNSMGAINILTHGEIGSGDQARDYGQNIPFVAVFVQEIVP